MHHYFRLMVDVYYPFVESKAKWQKLKYSLRSIERNFPFDFKVWITGDLPEWITGMNHIPHKKCVGKEKKTIYDVISEYILLVQIGF